MGDDIFVGWDEHWSKEKDRTQNIVNITEPIGLSRIYCTGDCFVSGVKLDNKQMSKVNFAHFLDLALKEKYQVLNLGATMLTVKDMVRFFELFMPKDSERNDIGTVWCGTNDLYVLKTPPNDLLEQFKTYCNFLKEKSIKVIPMTVLPRSDILKNIDSAQFERDRIIFNQMLREEYPVIIDVASSNDIGLKDQELNGKYYNQDRVHLTEDGYKIVIEMAVKVIESLPKNTQN